ncbi:MAG: RNA-guided endonuclease InsQ/TnpB family protein [Leptolyngbyaceae cyanobacterium]
MQLKSLSFSGGLKSYWHVASVNWREWKRDLATWNVKKTQMARLWLKIKRRRTDFFYRVAHWLCERYDLIAYEKLNIKGLARTQLAKSILDAAWGEFLSILQAVAVKRGKHSVEVAAKRTSIECSECGAEVRRSLSDRVHHCPSCRLIIDRDWNAARNILCRAPGYQLSGCGGYGVARPVTQQLSIAKLRSSRYVKQLVL